MYEDKTTRRPVIGPLMLALKSRRVIVALAALLVGALTALLPDLEPVRDELLSLIVALALAVIGGYTLEDAARAARERAAVPPETVRELVKEALNSIVDETKLPNE